MNTEKKVWTSFTIKKISLGPFCANSKLGPRKAMQMSD